MVQTFSITNRYGLKIVGILTIPEESIGCSFVLHGLGGRKNQPCIETIAQVLVENKYIVVNFDATNSTGESEGMYENATMQKHYEDLVDVINWAKLQPWCMEPFLLAGHSMGAYAVLQYAENFPHEVRAVFPHATVVSGQMSIDAHKHFDLNEITEWERTGWTTRTSTSRPDLVLKLPWSHMLERLNHDLTREVSKLTMPVLFVVGENDGPCPPAHQKYLFDLLPFNSKNEFHIVQGASHTFKLPEHLKQLHDIFEAWLRRI